MTQVTDDMVQETLLAGNVCGCMGPLADDPYCPCRMQTLKLDGAYNCHGDKEALAARNKASEESFTKAMRDYAMKIKEITK